MLALQQLTSTDCMKSYFCQCLRTLLESEVRRNSTKGCHWTGSLQIKLYYADRPQYILSQDVASGSDVMPYVSQGAKTCLSGFANNKGPDQPVHRHSLISSFVVRLLESTLSKLASSEFSIF